jgi:AAA family ATP:ADP antiporter
MASNKTESSERSALERALSIVSEVRAGEGATALLLTTNVFFLLVAYYVIKPVREGLILAMEGGAEKKSYASAAIAITLLFAVPAYSKVANKISKHKLVVGMSLFFATHLVVFWLLSHTRVRSELGLVFFTWVGVFNMMVVAQFWSFANDVYTQEQGKRLFAIVGIGASLGSAVGAYITKFLKGVIGLGVFELLLVAGAVLVLCAFLTHTVYRREKNHASGAGEPEREDREGHKKEAALAETGEGGFTLVRKNKYLLLLAAFSLVFTIVDTNGEFILSTLVAERAKAAATAQHISAMEMEKFTEGFIASYYGGFYLWVNLIGLVVQTFLVSRIVKLGGLKLAFFLYPVVALGSSLNNVLTPLLFGVDRLSAFRPTKTMENATDYSLNNTVRNMLWLPTTTEVKYKAKQAVDTFFVRMGDVASAGLVFIVSASLSLPVQAFSMINIVLVVLWLLIAVGIVRENARLSEQKDKRESQAPESSNLDQKPASEHDKRTSEA